MQSQHLLFSLLFPERRGGMEVEQGGRTKEEEEVVASRLLFFLVIG